MAVRRLQVAAPFAGQSFVYRTGNSSYEQDPYAQFLVPPDQSLAEPLRAWLRSSDHYQAVTEPGSVVKPDLHLEVFVPELYGDFRDRAAPAAVLSMEFVFLDASARSRGRVLASRTISRRIPLRARTAAAVMAGWEDALKEIMKEGAAAPPTSSS